MRRKLEKFSFGIGDRFAREAEAQLQAIQKAKAKGVEVTPVWNKSCREHDIIGSHPSETRRMADLAVKNLDWKAPYFVDADHINLRTVDLFLEHADFFTLDVAESISLPAPGDEIRKFVAENRQFLGYLTIPGIAEPFRVDEGLLSQIASKYLMAAREAHAIYGYIASRKGEGNFITEVSMDEVAESQTPVELFFILRMLSGIPVQTIAPKFTGYFYKGVDYAGDPFRFGQEFEAILLVLEQAKKQFGLPEELKLSIHSGSDKFTLYPIIRKLASRHGQGIHLKTAGTTWLEEVIGLALSGGDALALAKEIYAGAFRKMEELCSPYRSVIQIDHAQLPDPGTIQQWDGEKFANTLRHIPDHPAYNPNFRQLLHVGYKIAARMGERYLLALEQNREVISAQVTENLYERHIIPLFIS